MKQKVSTVPKGKLSTLGIGPYQRKDRNVKSILTESSNRKRKTFIVSLSTFMELNKYPVRKQIAMEMYSFLR